MENSKSPFDRELLTKLIAAFLREVGADADCLSCKKNDWSVVPNNLVTTMLDGQERYISTATLICNNCGFVRSHAFEVFQEWMKRRIDREDISNG